MSSSGSQTSALPQQFGPYRILRPLGKGGMGTVYLARDTRLDRDVALKVCTLVDNPQTLQRFRIEAKAAASLSHTNLCPVYEFDVRDGIAYLAMAFVEGPTLNAWVTQRGGVSQREAAVIVAKLALAMQVAHDAGVLHRDLKPANVIISKKGEPVILDFGLARQLDDAGTRLTQQGAIYGTASYMAPEQAGGDPTQIGPACDVYGLGVMLYELLTGEVPFQGSMMAVLSQLLNNPPQPVRARKPSVDATLESICMKALAKDPADRQRSMKELAKALAQIARTVPATAKKSGPPPLPSAGSIPTHPDVSRRKTTPPTLATTAPDVIDLPLNSAAPKQRRKKAPRGGRRKTWIARLLVLLLLLSAAGIALYYKLRTDPADKVSESAHPRTNREMIVGTWDEMLKGDEEFGELKLASIQYTFRKDGTMTFSVSDMDKTFSGTYSVDGDNLNTTLKELGGETEKILKLSDRELVLMLTKDGKTHIRTLKKVASDRSDDWSDREKKDTPKEIIIPK